MSCASCPDHKVLGRDAVKKESVVVGLDFDLIAVGEVDLQAIDLARHCAGENHRFVCSDRLN
jgi:hypothetical protein